MNELPEGETHLHLLPGARSRLERRIDWSAAKKESVDFESFARGTHGATELTRIPLGMSCIARLRVKVVMAPLVAE